MELRTGKLLLTAMLRQKKITAKGVMLSSQKVSFFWPR